jgi:hypothetical protein
VSNTIGDTLLRGGRSDVGVGYPIDPKLVPEEIPVVYGKFDSGLILMSPEETPPDAAVMTLDMEVSRAGRLIRAPGLGLVEDALTHNLRYSFEQASLDYTTELVTIDPPYFGWKGGSAYTWVNAGIAGTGIAGWTGVDIAGTLLFSNGINASYSRLTGAGAVVDQSAQVIARTFGVAFGRTFAGYYQLPGPAPQSIGLKWNAASGAFDDWSGLGAGAELLLSDVGEADKLLCLLPIGLDVLGIFMRQSIWVGYPTGDYLRPADPRIRARLGAVNRDSVKAVMGGAAYLTDEGVALFDLTNVQIISSEINAELLPLDYTRINQYVAAYLPLFQRYILCTPFCTWIYEFPHQGRKGRWFKRSLKADSVVAWTEQSGGVYWDRVVGSWDTMSGSWDSLAQIQSDAPAVLHFVLGTKLARENRGAFDNLGPSLTPIWQTPQSEKVKVTDQYSTMGFEIEYSSGANSSIRLSGNDLNGEQSPITATKNLPITNGKRVKYNIDCQSTGMGAQAFIEILSGDPEIIRVRQKLLPAGPTLVAL